jgi:hypothetical protein
MGRNPTTNQANSVSELRGLGNPQSSISFPYIERVESSIEFLGRLSKGVVLMFAPTGRKTTATVKVIAP